MSKDKKKRGDYTVFQADSHFNGILNFTRPLRILGKYTGEINGKGALEIGPTGKVEAHITATEIIILGHVTGNIAASQRVELRNGATLIGNIRSPSLEIDDGVIFEGQCEMKTTEINRNSTQNG